MDLDFKATLLLVDGAAGRLGAMEALLQVRWPVLLHTGYGRDAIAGGEHTFGASKA